MTKCRSGMFSKNHSCLFSSSCSGYTFHLYFSSSPSAWIFQVFARGTLHQINQMSVYNGVRGWRFLKCSLASFYANSTIEKRRILAYFIVLRRCERLTWESLLDAFLSLSAFWFICSFCFFYLSITFVIFKHLFLFSLNLFPVNSIIIYFTGFIVPLSFNVIPSTYSSLNLHGVWKVAGFAHIAVNRYLNSAKGQN